MLLSALREEYVTTNTAIRSKETARLLRISCEHFAKLLGYEPTVHDLTDRNLAAYIQWRRAAGRKETTIEREMAKLLTLARYAAASAMIPAPRLRLTKAPVDPPVAFMRGEIRGLFRAAAKYNTTVGEVNGAVYFLALLNLIWDTGERIGAILEIEQGDIDLTNRWVTIRHRKRNGAAQTKRLRRATVRALRKLMDSHQFRTPFGFMHRTSLYHHLNQLLKSAKIPVNRRHKFHCLRRSHASWLHRAGGDATASLGHSDPAITRKYYFDRRITERWQAIDWLFSPVGIWGRLLTMFGL